MNKDSNVLLILERSSSNLDVNKESGDYILEGIFAQFGVENNNKRIYEEKEYLPHLEYLKKKISENRLMGELDHPEKFEIALDKVSHVIENIEYDQAKRQIKGRVRILDTPSGKIAKSLIDSNIPISISSRAAGSVSENKTVSIKRIFTYDLVADPGFEDAQLSRINESFGLDNENNLQIFDASRWDNNFSFDEKEKEKPVEAIKENKENTTDMKEFVTIESMERYSLMVKEEIAKINTRLETLNESNANSDETAELRKTVDNLVGYVNEMATEINQNREYMSYTAEMLDESISWSENEIGNQVTKLIEYTESELAVHLDGLIEHNNYLAEKLNTTIGYVNEELAPILDESINHNDYLVEQIANNRKYTEYLAENAVDSTNFDSLVEYTEHVYENAAGKFEGKINESATAEDVIKKHKLKTHHDVAKFIGDFYDLPDTIKGSTDKFTFKDVEDNVIKVDGKAGTVDGKKLSLAGLVDLMSGGDFDLLIENQANKINENKNVSTDIENRYMSINEKIDAALEQIKKTKTEEITESKRHPFTKLLNESNRAAFTELGKTEKEKVSKALNENGILSTVKLNEKFTSLLEGNFEIVEEPKWLSEAPDKYKAIFESLNEETQDKLRAQASWYEGKLKSPYQIENFWATRGLNEDVELKNLKDDADVKLIKESNDRSKDLGYSSDRVAAIKQGLKRFK